MTAPEPRSFSPDRDIHTAEPPLNGKRVLITGGTTGIGRAVAALLASDGAKVFIFGRHAPELEDALQHIRSVGGDAEGMVADQARRADIDRVLARSDEVLGGLDVLIANAGLGAGKLAETPEDEWRYVLETNLAGYIAFAQEAAKRLAGRDGAGQIALVGSISADADGEGSAVYAASKGGVRAFAKSFREEVAKTGIRVALVEPGTVGSDMNTSSPAAQREKIRKHEMLRAEDIAVAVRYILTQPERCDIPLLRIEPRIQL
ncbi:MAG: SDR family oxidoreductase [Pseudomonadota bacterium]